MDVVRSWMSAPAVCVLETAGLNVARRLMRMWQIRRLPVLDAVGRLVGIVTAGDVYHALERFKPPAGGLSHAHKVITTAVREIMIRPVVTVVPDTPVLEVAQLLLMRGIGAAPVVERSQVIGIITESDLFRNLVTHMGNTRCP